MKKKNIIFLLIIVLLFPLFEVRGSNYTYDDTKNAGYLPLSTETTDLNGGVIHQKVKAETLRNNVKYSQQVNVLSMKTNENAKVATWAIINDDGSGFIRDTVANIASDYEKRHPGWKVVGGINADQYYTKSGTKLKEDGSAPFFSQPYYPMIADYEKWFAITATPYQAGHVVGFLNDGSADQLVYQNAGWNYQGEDKAEIDGLYLSFIKEGKRYRYKIENFNCTPKDGESSIHSPYYLVNNTSLERSISGKNIFVVEDADLAYTSNSTTYSQISPNNENAFFGKGTITKIVDSYQLSKGQFAIETKNQELLNLLKVNDYVTAQFEFEGVLNEVESAIGFHKIMRIDNVDKEMTGDYNIKAYPRSVFGRKSDGTIVFLTVDGSQSSQEMNGVNMEECNAILKHYGVVEAYQLDGGGSVTMIVRNRNTFTTVNSPSDGSDRKVLSALLFVVKEVEVEAELTVTQNKISFEIDILEDNVEKLFVRLNDETKEVIDGKVEFDNLSPNTTYKYRYIVEKDGKQITGPIEHVINTTKRLPELKYLIIKHGNDNIIIETNFDDPDNSLSTYIRINIGNENYLVKNNNAIIDNIQDFTVNDISITYRYNLNDKQGDIMITENSPNLKPDIKATMQLIRNGIEKKIKIIYDK